MVKAYGWMGYNELALEDGGSCVWITLQDKYIRPVGAVTKDYDSSVLKQS